MRILDRAPNNGNGANAAESLEAEEPVAESDNPFNEAGAGTTEGDISERKYSLEVPRPRRLLILCQGLS
jgi:hypothetical protein